MNKRTGDARLPRPSEAGGIKPPIEAQVEALILTAQQAVRGAEFDLGFSILDKALELSRRYNLPKCEGDAEFSLHESYNRLNFADLNRPKIHANRALRAYQEAGDDQGRFKCYSALALIATYEGQFKIGKFYLREMKNFSGPDEQWLTDYVDSQLASAEGRGDDAIRLLTNCLSSAHRLTRDRDHWLTQARRRLASLLGGRPGSSSNIESALAVANQFGAGKAVPEITTDTWRDYSIRALLLLQQGTMESIEEGFGLFIQLLTFFDATRSGTVLPEKQRALSAFTEFLSGPAVRAMLAKGETSAAFAAAEIGQSLGVLALTSMAKWLLSCERSAEQKEKETVLQRQERHAFTEFRRTGHETAKKDWDYFVWRRRELLYERYETALQFGIGRYPKMDQTFTLSELASFSDVMPPKTAYVSFISNLKTAFIVTRAGVRTVPLPLSPEEGQSLVNRYRRHIDRLAAERSFLTSQSVIDGDEDLFASFVGPIAPYLSECTSIYLSPVGGLWSVPLHAIGGKRALTLGYAVSYVFGARVLAYLLNRHGEHAGSPYFLGVADPDGSLLGARAEIELARQLAPTGTVLIGEEATLASVIENMKRASIVHFGCHGEYFDDYPEFSYLKLAGPSGAVDRLEVAGIVEMPITADLVVLGACRSGRGGLFAGNEFVGFPSAFLAAGARTVLGSLWRIDDAASAFFMEGFYRALSEHSKAEAYRAAYEIMSKSKFSHPYYQAAFQLFGLLT
jgi:CHAT domain-containing protein